MSVLRLFDLLRGEISTVRLTDTDQYIREVGKYDDWIEIIRPWGSGGDPEGNTLLSCTSTTSPTG